MSSDTPVRTTGFLRPCCHIRPRCTTLLQVAPPSPRPGSLLPGSRRGRALRVLAVPALLAVAVTAAAPGGLRLGLGLLQGSDADAHQVVPGDTLWDLAQRAGVTVQRLKALNHLAGDTIVVGQLLQLPGAGADATPAPDIGTDTSTPAPSTRSYVVVTGDTLTAIAARGGVSATAVKTLNHLPADGTVQLGATLLLPAPAVSAAASAVAPPELSVGGMAGSRLLLAAQPAFSRTEVRQLVRDEAVRQGVPADLALAVAYQESGFTHAVVSSTDAVGVMQLMPATADWIGPAALGRRIDRYEVHDNVAGGVALLRVLLRVTDTRTAVAAYYQGLAQVRRRGLLPETQTYVANVLALRQRFG